MALVIIPINIILFFQAELVINVTFQRNPVPQLQYLLHWPYLLIEIKVKVML